jgi:hypothetical protein
MNYKGNSFNSEFKKGHFKISNNEKWIYFFFFFIYIYFCSKRQYINYIFVYSLS